MIRCYQPPQYGERDCPRLTTETCGIGWHVLVTPLCPVAINGTQREAVEYALRTYGASWRWRASSAGINGFERADLLRWAQEAP